MSRKNHRRNRWKRPGENGVCFRFRDSGSCEFGESCRFVHSEATDEEKRSSIVDTDDSYFPTNHSGGEIFRPRPPEHRYFERFIVQRPNKESLFLHLHSNGIVVLGIATGHPALDRTARQITKLCFLSKGKNLAEFQVSGKRKKGGTWLDPTHPICTIVCSDGAEFSISAGIRARLYEVNSALETNPELVYGSQGYLVVVAPKKEEISAMRKVLVPENDYETQHIA